MTCFLFSESGLQWLSEEFSLCTPLKNKNDAISLKSWLEETWVNLAMVDYPYEANFLEPLPRWPIQVWTATKHILRFASLQLCLSLVKRLIWPDSLSLIEMNVRFSRLCYKCLLWFFQAFVYNSCRLTALIFIRIGFLSHLKYSLDEQLQANHRSFLLSSFHLHTPSDLWGVPVRTLRREDVCPVRLMGPLNKSSPLHPG